MTLRRLAGSGLAGVAGLALLLGPLATPAAADPPAPGDVASAVSAIVPPVEGLRAEVIGGDSFLRVSVPRGTELVVLGYEDEPYLRVLTDGTVEVNDRSPARWLNENRLGAVSLPADADAAAAPRWRRTGGRGQAAWHDHRIHWMATTRPNPPQKDWVVPVLVDGEPVRIEGTYRYVAPPPAWPWWAGTAALAVLVAVLAWRRRAVAVGAVVVAGGIAVVIGAGLWRLPGGRGQGVAAVALGGFAVVAAAVAAVLARRARAGTRSSVGAAMSGAFLAAGGAALVLYGLRRADVFGHAVLVTDWPEWLDRLSVASALGAGAAAVVVGVRAVVAPAAPAAPAAPDPDRQSGAYHPPGMRASASGGPQDPRS